MRRGVQNPPWQRPMPDLVRRLMPSSVRAPTRARIDARISPSVTPSQRQMTRPKPGSRSTSSASASGAISRVFGHQLTSFEMSAGFFLDAPSFAATCPAIQTPIAGADVRPGDSTPTALKNPGASGASPRMKSPTVVSWARSPENSVMTLSSGSPG